MLEQLNLLLAFGAGLLSFVSPCSLPLYPAFLSYVTGISFNELKRRKRNFEAKISDTYPAFYLVFYYFYGTRFSTSFIGQIFIQYKEFLRQIGAIIMVFLD